MFNQAIFLISTLLRMRSWRQILILPIAAFSLLGFRLCHFISRDWVFRYVSQELKGVHPTTFRTPRLKIACDEVRFKMQCNNARTILHTFTKTRNPTLLAKCKSISTCFSQVYNSMLSNTKNPLLCYMDFRNSTTTTICQSSYTDMTECSFTGAVAALANLAANKPENWFGTIRTFQQIGLPRNLTALDPAVCDTEMNVSSKLPTIIMFQMVLLTVMVCIYTLLSTVSCMHELKSRGFLQLMMRKGLSPFAYWASVGIPTTLEVLLLSCCQAASFYLLCPGVYTISQLVYSNLITAVYLLCTTTFVLLMTVLSNSYFTITKWVVLYMAASIVSTVGNRLVHDIDRSEFSKLLRRGLLLLPSANVVEQLYANLIDPVIDANYYTAGLLVNVLATVVLGVATLYLDNVLSTGNKFCYPLSYPFRRVPSDEPMPDAVSPSEFVELPKKPTVFVRIFGISPNHKASISGSISVDFYDEQITAIYCEDTARNSWLLSALTGRVRAHRGTVWVNGCISSKPMSRPHNRTRLGECLQEDTLCHSLTVLYTLQMAFVSSMTSWVESEMNRLLTLLRLSDTLNSTVGSLSASQRRKLCIALALIGNTRFIILNDPTRTLDPLSRLRFWHLLQFYRQGRCIVVSTQFIDETDVFADRKVFLSPTANFVLFAGSSKFIRRSTHSDAVLLFTLRSKDKSQAVIEICQKILPLGVTVSLDENQLSIFLSNDAESIISDLIQALRSVETDILTVGLHHTQLSGIYSRLKGLKFDGVNSAQRSAGIARVPELPRAGNYKHVGSKRKSQTNFIRAMCAIFLLNSVLLYREWVRSVNRMIVIVLLLALHGAMHAMETTVASAGSTVWTNASIVPAAKFVRGFCVSDKEAVQKFKMYNHQCGTFFSGEISVGGNFLALQKPVKLDINEFLLKWEQKKLLYDHCNQTNEEELPCPIVYSSDWSNETWNNKRQVSIGAFSRFSQYKPQKSAVSIYNAYMATLAHFSPMKPAVTSKLLIFIDFRNILFNLYGVYSQMFIFTVLPALFLDEIMEHKTSKWRSYLTSLGVCVLSYWAGILPLHWLQCFVAYGLSVCISIGMNPSAYLAVYQSIVFSLTASLGLVNNLMLAYLLSLFIPISRRTFPVAYLLVSVFTVFASLFVQTMELVSVIAIAVWPPFASAALTYYSVKIYNYSRDFDSIGTVAGLPKMDVIFGQRQVFICLFAIPVQTAALAVMLYVLDRRLCPRKTDCCRKIDCCSSQSSTSIFCVSRSSEEDDEYVNVNNPSAVLGDQCAKIVAKDECPIILKKLKKSYANGIKAVRNITLGVESGDFVAIVGPNASGMTTIVDTILGKRSPTKGMSQVRIDDVSTTGRKVGISGLIAYSPQWDPLFAAATVKEHLRYYARMQGASAGMVLQLLEDTDLMKLRNQPTRQLTPGQRRRLCVAISLLSCSPLLLIDDASTGMSSDEVRQLWRSLSKNFDRYLSGVLTAHSLAGAEAIGCRVAIINQGLMDFLGTVEQFRQQHRMYIIELEFKSKTIKAARKKKIDILKAVFKRFFSASVFDQTMTWVKVFIPVQREDSQFESLLWLLKLKKNYEITDLAFYPATVDQTLELVYKNHEAEVQRQSEALMNPDAAPLSPFYESYDI